MAGAQGMTADEFAAYTQLHGGKVLGASPILGDPSGAMLVTFPDGTEINAVENQDGSVNVTKFVKAAPRAAGAAPREVKGPDGTVYSENPDGSLTAQTAAGAPKPVPAADQTMPGTGTPASPGSLGSPLADGPDPSLGWSQGTPATPDLTVGQFSAQTARNTSDNTAKNDAALRASQAASAALAQTQAEYNRGQDAIKNKLADNTFTLAQATQAADVLYKQADLELRSRIADITAQGQAENFGTTMATEEMKRLPAGTAAAMAPMWAAAAKGQYVAPNLPQDNRDPVQIALNAIAQYKASLGNGTATPAQTAYAGVTPAAATGLTLPPPAPLTAPATAPTAAPLAPPVFPVGANIYGGANGMLP